MSYRKTILLDFDGVLSQYQGWQGPDVEPGPPVEGARAACFGLAKQFKLICFTTRNKIQVEPWLAKYGFTCIEGITSIKIPAYLQIDDRSIQFNGQWSTELIARAKNFKPWWEKEDAESK